LTILHLENTVLFLLILLFIGACNLQIYTIFWWIDESWNK